MKAVRVCFFCLPLWLLGTSTAWADVYRCVQPSGAVLYSDEPCAKGTRGGQVDIQPSVLDSKEGRERNQKALEELKLRKAPGTAEQEQTSSVNRSSAAPPASEGRVNRLEQCQPLLEEASGVRRQAIGALCGADLDDAMFDSCLAKVQDADSTGEMEALVRACTGSGLGGGAVLVPAPVHRRNPAFTHCDLFPRDPVCRQPVPLPPAPSDRMKLTPKPPKPEPVESPKVKRGSSEKPQNKPQAVKPEDTDRR